MQRMPDATIDRELLQKAWGVLVTTAREGKTISYSELAMAVGMPRKQRSIHRLVVSPLCSLVCTPKGFPDLASLVVRKDTGQPGDGWWAPLGGKHTPEIWRDELRAVHSFEWPEDLPL